MKTLIVPILSTVLMAGLTFATFLPAADAASRRSSDPYPKGVSAEELREKYAEAALGGEKVRILIMPGHEAMDGGAQFGGYYERELVVDIAMKLEQELNKDENFEVFVARGTEGWNGDFEYYFDRRMRQIERFVEDAKEEHYELEDRGRIEEETHAAAHNSVPGDYALRLYGVSKWANENDIDLVLHLHLNDEAGRVEAERGAHSGAAIYIPDSIYSNSEASRAVAEPVFARLMGTSATSTFAQEREGVVESRELIAVGAFNTSDAPSLLLEYGYLYEPRITGDGPRELVFADYARQTADGVREAFGAPVADGHVSVVLPRAFNADFLAVSAASSTATSSPERARDVYALQAALRELGFYPGTEASLGVCPVSGILNECTTLAVKAFQASKGLEQTGTLGPRTRAALNVTFGLVSPVLAVTPTVTAAATMPAEASCSPFEHDLALESTDEDTDGEVSRLQRILALDSAVYPEALVTGYYGAVTDRAVKRFQVSEGIVTSSSSAYGLVGPATTAALIAACEAGA